MKSDSKKKVFEWISNIYRNLKVDIFECRSCGLKRIQLVTPGSSIETSSDLVRRTMYPKCPNQCKSISRSMSFVSRVAGPESSILLVELSKQFSKEHGYTPEYL